MQWIDALIQGVLLGGMYAQYALGMALMFGVMRIVHITHGDLVILLALIGISLSGWLGVGSVAVLCMLVPLAAFIGWSLQKLVLNKVVGDDPLPSLIATFGLSIALQNLMLTICSADTRTLPGGGIESQSVEIGGIFLGVLPIIVLIVAIALTGGLDTLLRFNRFGRAFWASSAAWGRSGGRSSGPWCWASRRLSGSGSIRGCGILVGHLVFLMILALRPQGILGRKSCHWFAGKRCLARSR